MKEKQAASFIFAEALICFKENKNSTIKKLFSIDEGYQAGISVGGLNSVRLTDKFWPFEFGLVFET